MTLDVIFAYGDIYDDDLEGGFQGSPLDVERVVRTVIRSTGHSDSQQFAGYFLNLIPFRNLVIVAAWRELDDEKAEVFGLRIRPRWSWDTDPFEEPDDD